MALKSINRLRNIVEVTDQSAIHYDSEQNLTAEQQAQVQEDIGVSSYLEVVDATARLALTGKTNGTHVREIGRPQIVTLTVSGGSTYTPAVAEQTRVVCQANVGTSTSFYWGTPTASYSIWFNVDGTGVDPVIGADVTLEVTLPASPTAAQTATAIKAAVDGIAGSPFGTATISGAGSDTVTWTNAVAGQNYTTGGSFDIDTGFTITNPVFGTDYIHSLITNTPLHGTSNVPLSVQVGAYPLGDIPVTLPASNQTAEQVAALIATAIHAHADFTASAAGAVVTIASAVNAGTSRVFTAEVSDLITCYGHGLTVNDVIRVTSTGALPAGLSAGVDYHVIASGLNQYGFKVSTSQGGSAVNITDVGTGRHKVVKVARVGAFTVEEAQEGISPTGIYELMDSARIASEDGWAMLGGRGDASAPRVMRLHGTGYSGSVIEMDAGGTGNGSIGRIQFCRSTDPATPAWRGLIFSVNGLITDEGTRPKDDPARGWSEFHLESNYFGKSEARLLLSGQSIFTITSPESDPDNVDWVNYAPQYSIVLPGNTLTLQGLPVPTHGLEDWRASGASLRLYSAYAILTKFDWIALNGTLKLRDQAAEADRITVTQAGKVKLGVLLNLPVYTNSSPEDGDLWRADNTDTGLKVRINGVTKTITVT